MRFKFKTNKLKLLYTEEKGARKYEVAVVDAFFEVMTVIDAAKDIRDLYNLKGLRFEKLSGKRRAERSIRLNRQWRLIVQIEKDEQENVLLIIDIEDYH